MKHWLMMERERRLIEKLKGLEKDIERGGSHAAAARYEEVERELDALDFYLNDMDSPQGL